MVITGRSILFIISGLVLIAGLVLLIQPANRILAGLVVLCGIISVILLWVYRPPAVPRHIEDEQIEDLPEDRCQELIRGTSLFLREMRYRYSVRYDRSERARFTAEVNGVRVGFVPAVISDNLSERQGYGYVGFVYDNSRWRGPGLPCGGTPQQAVEYAARCISPLDTQPTDGPDGNGAADDK